MTIQSDLPVAYECGCNVLCDETFWHLIVPKCPDHGKPVRRTNPNALRPRYIIHGGTL